MKVYVLTRDDEYEVEVFSTFEKAQSRARELGSRDMYEGGSFPGGEYLCCEDELGIFAYIYLVEVQ